MINLLIFSNQASELGLDDDLEFVHAKNKAAKNRYMYFGGKLEKVPSGFFGLFKTMPGTKTKLYKVISRDLSTPKIDATKYPQEDPSIHEFFSYRLGEEAADAIFNPLLRGITAGDSRKLSLKANFQAFFDAEQLNGSVIKGMFKNNPVLIDESLSSDIAKATCVKRAIDERVTTYNFKNGLETLTERLCDSIMSGNDKDAICQIYNQSPVERISFQKNKEWDISVRTLNGESVTVKADHIFAALPSNYLADILDEDSGTKSTLVGIKKTLKQTPFAPVACVCLEYHGIKNSLPEEAQAFGFLTHSGSNSKVLGITFDSAALPIHDNGRDLFRMTAMIGGSWFEQIFGTNDVDSVPDEKYINIALDEIKKILNISCEPARVTVRVWKDGIAQYIVGHKSRTESIRKHIEELSLPITLLGQSYDGVSINDIIYSSRTKASKFIKDLP